MDQGASFADVVAGLWSDTVGMFTGQPLALAPFQKQIDAATVALNAANRAGDTAKAQSLVQQINDLKARAALMPNPLVGRAATVENVQMALDGVEAPFAAVNAWAGKKGAALFFGVVGLGLLYAYAKRG